MTMAANRSFRAFSTVCAIALLAIAGGAAAQQLYRSVDPNGRVVFSDQPPAAVGKAAPAPARAGATPNTPTATAAATTSASTAGLPFELRQVAQRYPVMLYTGDDCAPCDTGRSLLTTRGVPFEERTVKTSQDTDALTRLSGQASLPLLSIGTQQLKGYSDAEWSQYLDAAGYPKSNSLPPGYRNGLVRPLVAQQAAPAPAAPAAPAPGAPCSASGPGAPCAPSACCWA